VRIFPVRHKIYLLICLIGAFLNENLSAVNDNWLSGARFSAMGNIGVMCADLWSVSHNQAGLGFYDHLSAGFHHENRFTVAEFSLNSAAFTLPTQTGTFGLSFSCFGYSSYHENKAGLAFGKSLNKWFSAGIQFDYLNTYVADETGNINSMAIEAGIMVKPVKDLSVGVHIYNPTGSHFNGLSVKERIPVIFSMGAGYNYQDKLFIAIETSKDLEMRPVFYKAGLEYRVKNFLFIRTGVIISEYISNSFGLGLVIKKIRADLAFSHQQIIGFTPHLSIQYWFR
jgi:hypothetical protein